MRKTLFTMVAVLGALAAQGCASDVGDAGATLRAVDEGTLTSQVLYMAPDVSAIPLAAAELEALGVDRADATPVRVEVFDDVAVAWHAPYGEPVITREGIVALWSVVNRVPTAGELEAGESPVVVSPSGTSETPTVAWSPSGVAAEVEEDLSQTPTVSTAEQTIIDFFDRVGTPEELWFVGQLAGYHPGCI
jgi:hypothetical protein